MGAWPEFNQCCGVVPLRKGAILIGVYILVYSVIQVVLYTSVLLYYENSIRNPVSEEIGSDETTKPNEENDSMFEYIIVSWFIIIHISEAIIGGFILYGINKANILRKTVAYMTVMWLLNLLVSLVNASREAYMEAYLNAVSMLVSAYFILIIRSLHLQLEGRLRRSQQLSSRQLSISENILSIQNPAYRPPPPNYEESTRNQLYYINSQVVRCEPLRTNMADTVIETNEISTQIIPNNETAVTAVLSVEEQTTVNPRRLSTQLSGEFQKDEPMIPIKEERETVNSGHSGNRPSVSDSGTSGSNFTTLAENNMRLG